MDEKAKQSSMEDIIAEYGNYSEDALLATVVNTIAAQKNDGTFDVSAALELKNMLLPMLNDSQREKLMRILNAVGVE